MVIENQQEILVKNKEEMIAFAASLAKNSKKGDIFGLKGTLGAGKSFFAHAFINSLSDEPVDVTSPTFNLMNLYEVDGYPDIYHLDLYRLNSEEELFNLGIEDALIEGITLIEWPDLAHNFLKKNYTQIDIKIGEGENRIINIKKS